MPQYPAKQYITHTFGGGWGPDFGPSYYGSPNADGSMPIPWLLDAENAVFELDGGPHKCPGTTQLNATTLGATSPVKGVFDYWRQGTGGSPAQRVVAHSDTRVVYDSGGGTMTNLATGLVEGAVPQYSVFDDILLLTNDAVADVPRSWDQTTFQNLAGTPPNFSFSIPHRNRHFGAGVLSLPSRLYYSVSLDPEDWAGAGSGSIDILPNDGDMITAIASHRSGDLIVFKGPYKGSIHRVTGSSSSDFAVTPIAFGVGAAWQNTVFTFGDDLGWVSPRGTVHSLATTERFGDYTQSYLSYPWLSYSETGFNHGRLRHAWAQNHPTKGYALITFAGSGSTNNNRVLMMDYRFLAQGERYPRWSLWTSFSLASLGPVLEANSRPRMYAGNYTGRILRGDQAARTNNGVAINYKVRTPWMTYGNEWAMKTLHGASIGIRSKNSNTMTLRWQRDNNTTQSQTTTQGGGSVWGPTATGAMVWGTGRWGGGQYTPRFVELEEGGEFRSVNYEITDTANNSDLEVHNLGVGLTIGSFSMENT